MLTNQVCTFQDVIKSDQSERLTQSDARLIDSEQNCGNL